MEENVLCISCNYNVFCDSCYSSFAMEHRLTVDVIRPGLPDWVCKIQVVEKFHRGDSKDHTVHFQTIVVEDENAHQVAIVLYGVDIDKSHLCGSPLLSHICCRV